MTEINKRNIIVGDDFNTAQKIQHGREQEQIKQVVISAKNAENKNADQDKQLK